MDEIQCLAFILCCFGFVLCYMVYNVKVRGLHLRRTANDDLKLLADRGESRFAGLQGTVNGLITVEAAFASVTTAVLFVVVGIIVSGTVTLSEPVSLAVNVVIAALAMATVCWILSLELLSHLISPSLPNEVFVSAYQEALNLWNVGFMLLLLFLCFVLIPVSTTIAASIAGLTTLLSIRVLALIHQWGPTRLKAMPISKPASHRVIGPTNPWVFSWGMTTVALMLFPLYVPLNHATGPVHSMFTPPDASIPFVPGFALPYLSYFLFIALTVIVQLAKKDRTGYERFWVAIILTLAVSYLFYGFFQTGMHRADLASQSGLFADMVANIYASDNPYNAFPSTHSSISVICMLALWTWRRGRWLIALWTVLIVASTMLVKQHYLVDAVAGVILGAISFLVAGRLVRCRTLVET